MAAVVSPPAPNLSSEIELFLACRNLPNLDTFSKSDPFVVFYMKDTQSGTYTELDRTETVQDNLNPDFSKQFKIDYRFEEVQTIRLDVYDSDSNSRDLSKHDFIGSAEITIGGLMGSAGQTKQLALTHPQKSGKRGYVIVRGEEIRACSEVLKGQFVAQGLEKSKFLFFAHRRSPFIEARRCREDGTYVKVWQSEVVHKNCNARWKPTVIPMQLLANGDIDRPCQFDIRDARKPAGKNLIGSFTCSVREMTDPSFVGNVIHPAKKNSGKSSGSIRLQGGEVQKVDSFLDYIAGGCEMNLMVAVDFTGSNGDPRSPSSLHYINPSGQFNEYQSAIKAVGDILMEYDSDQRVPFFGFGGVYGSTTSHCFPLNFNPADPEVEGVYGMLNAYQNGIMQVGLSGPTLFSQILAEAAAHAQHCTQEQQSYTVMLILTDGVINDMDGTIAHIVNASQLPLSIVIVGVGNANFDAMEVLDADDVPLQSRGVKMSRDIVQFVPYRDFRNQHFSVLAKHTLAEIPGQMLSYFTSRGIKPNNRTLFQPSESIRGIPIGGGAPGAYASVPTAVPIVASAPMATAVPVPVQSY